mgnify:FL=1
MKNLIAFFVLVCLMSCTSNHPFKSEISSSDSLISVLDTLSEKLAGMDLEKTEKIAKESSELRNYLSANYPDSTNRNFWVNKIGPLYSVQRNLSKFLAAKKDIHKEMEYSRDQLETFKNSLKDEKLSKEDAGKYLGHEFEAVDRISFLLNKYEPKVKLSFAEWEGVKDEMYRIADSLKSL